jgi:hypothetical protein
METKLTPCSPGDVGALEKTWSDVTSEELLEPPLYVPPSSPQSETNKFRSRRTYNDFIRAVQGARPTVTKDDVVKHIEFANEAGGEQHGVVLSSRRTDDSLRLCSRVSVLSIWPVLFSLSCIVVLLPSPHVVLISRQW